MAKVKENKRNVSSWGTIVQEPQSDHRVLYRGLTRPKKRNADW